MDEKRDKVIIINIILVKLSYKNPILIIIFWIFMKLIRLSETIVWLTQFHGILTMKW